MEEKFIIYQKFYDFTLVFYPTINRIPQSHRQVLGKYLEELCILLLVLVIKANRERGDKRLLLQKDISDNLDNLRILIRLTKDLRFLSIKRYAIYMEKLNEIVLMLSSWMHSNGGV